jgi:hypothetical protein
MSNLPAIRTVRMEALPERVHYVARPGLGALPSGTWTMLVFMMPQFMSAGFLIWAIWWPYPQTATLFRNAMESTVLLLALWMGALWLMLRGNRSMALGILIAPFTRLTVTDRRVIWSVPWSQAPLLEIAGHRVRGALIGAVDRRGRGDAAMLLVPGDPAADFDGNIHFDRLPDVHRFADALCALR